MRHVRILCIKHPGVRFLGRPLRLQMTRARVPICRYVPTSSVAIAQMGMPTLKVEIKADMMRRLTAQAERLWPGSKAIGRDRLTRDAIRRYARYCSGQTGAGTKR